MKDIQLTKEEQKRLEKGIIEIKKMIINSRLTDQERDKVKNALSVPNVEKLKTISWHIHNDNGYDTYYAFFDIVICKDTDGNDASLPLQLEINFVEDFVSLNHRYCIVKNTSSDGFVNVILEGIGQDGFLPDKLVNRLPIDLKEIRNACENLISNVTKIFNEYESDEYDSDDYDKVRDHINEKLITIFGKPKKVKSGSEKVNVIKLN